MLPASLLDTAFGAACHSDVQILCQPGPAEVIAAVVMACTTRTSRLNDVAGLADGSRLVQLSEEIGRIARTLATLAESPPRTAERRGGTEGVSTVRSRWSPDH